jgi:hypothetical protein
MRPNPGVLGVTEKPAPAVRRNNVIAANFKGDSRRSHSSTAVKPCAGLATHDRPLDRLLGDIVKIARAGPLRACDLSTYPATRRSRAAACVLAAPSVLFAPKQPSVPPCPRTPAFDTCTRPYSGFARIAEWGCPGHAGGEDIDFRFSNVANSRRELVTSFKLNQTSFRLRWAPAGLGFRRQLPVRSLRITAKAMTAMFAYPARVGHDVLCTRISSTKSFLFGNGPVAIQSNSPTAIEVARQENEQVPRNAAAATSNHSLP